MAGLCEGGNEPPGSLKASKQKRANGLRPCGLEIVMINGDDDEDDEEEEEEEKEEEVLKSKRLLYITIIKNATSKYLT
ncbi:hypothetical protein ANN_14819 [Periplaneta americana]|uniref:Uncharacterized protein n=1 Tax=Periplaneta americana TaxID=6978 RepID=A0ABQ8SXE9_PERAM|nr:hypothetical protein ANN_14819 [Periplaneta americana]